MLEWLSQLQAAADALASTGHDPLEIVAKELEQESSYHREFDTWRPSVVYAQISGIPALLSEAPLIEGNETSSTGSETSGDSRPDNGNLDGHVATRSGASGASDGQTHPR